MNKATLLYTSLTGKCLKCLSSMVASAPMASSVALTQVGSAVITDDTGVRPGSSDCPTTFLLTAKLQGRRCVEDNPSDFKKPRNQGMEISSHRLIEQAHEENWNMLLTHSRANNRRQVPMERKVMLPSSERLATYTELT